MLPKRNLDWNEYLFQEPVDPRPIEKKVSFRLEPITTNTSGGPSASTVSTRPGDTPSGKLRFGPIERSRIKELRNYNASTMLKNFQLPLVFRKQFYQNYPSGFLPPIQKVVPDCQRASRWRAPFSKSSKVVSIPPVERRATGFKSLKCRLEAKGVHVSAPKLENIEKSDYRKSDKKADDKKAEDKAEDKKAEDKKVDEKADNKKAEDRKLDGKKADDKKADDKKADDKAGDKKADDTKA
ncbi:uncharacterized protein [Antedon mediterranea]|uniref:uncharacterized protein n=1 Tax=Antedon mediterranea TaxID=105859 RepID=UPI003AF88E16